MVSSKPFTPLKLILFTLHLFLWIKWMIRGYKLDAWLTN
ncbi:hypothetical protein AZE42_13906 [Rhizopogon vesiculosus]|uniref:Uncharacterized protein n=1 Tax=Rhizopogon vesiculosus TaxID=180088 RepID=A0A1J8R3K2_9AGAM|nr:hypothetical protein AZE42_13906 [Rhizopogon vesiculosus]